MSFKRLDPEDLVISAESITAPVWTDYTPTLTTFFTSSAQENSSPGAFYIDVYQTTSSLDTAEIQFSIAYCDKKSSGSIMFTPGVPISPSGVNYGTYRNLVLGDEETDIIFGDKAPEYFYAITFDRARYREKLLPGTLELTLNNNGTTLKLIDNSTYTNTVSFTDAGRVYELYASGSQGIYGPSSAIYRDSGSYGKLLPDIGVILINGNTLAAPTNIGGLNFTSGRASNGDSKNTRSLFNIIKSGASFKMNSEETITSNFVFIRARNQEFNYSTNPSYITGSGELRHSEFFIQDPKAYFTTVGLYNDNNDLLAVAKLSRPLLKDSRKEALVRIKLDY
jgi:hypothetical protein